MSYISSFRQTIDVQPVLYLSFWLFSQFCTYMIFWLVIVKYSNTNPHIHIEQPENILYNFILFARLNRLDIYLRLGCVLICAIFVWVPYKCYGLLSHYTSFFLFLHSSFIHICTAVPKCNENYFPLKSYFNELTCLYLS